MPSNATELDRSESPTELALKPATNPPDGEAAGDVHGAGDPAEVRGAGDPAAGGLVEEEILVEEISIDGMCGVY